MCFEGVGYVVEFLAVASEEDCASAWAVAAAYDVAADVGRCVVECGREWLIEATVAWGGIRYGCFVEAFVVVVSIISSRPVCDSYVEGLRG